MAEAATSMEEEPGVNLSTQEAAQDVASASGMTSTLCNPMARSLDG